MQIPRWLTSLQRQFEERVQHQLRASRDGGVTAAVAGLQWPDWHWNWRWPWQDRRATAPQREAGEEYKKKVAALCSALKVDNVTDLQDLLGAMVLSECVYKRPDSEVIRAVNKFKADFGGQLVGVNYIQASLDHVPHRYLLAEAGNTLFVSFIGTKQLQDVVADVNFLQRAVFEDEDIEGDNSDGDDQQKVVDGATVSSLHPSTFGNNVQKGLGLNNGELPPRPAKAAKFKAAAHRGFLARAKGVPATELYKLAQRKDRRLVLCGHSLGGAVAVLATLAILRAFATNSISRATNKVQVKCITFSQPPVGNPALRDLVHKKGWQHHFRTYCIPEDVIPRILSPAYFDHFRSQTVDPSVLVLPNGGAKDEADKRQAGQAGKDLKKDGEQPVLGAGSVPNPYWRIARLAPLAGAPMQWLKGKIKEDDNNQLGTPNNGGELANTSDLAPSLKIHEDSEGVASVDAEVKAISSDGKPEVKAGGVAGGVAGEWLERVPSLPSLPSYVPFGELYLLEKLAVQQLSASEFTQLSSVQSVLLELRERCHSHSMKSYRARFQQIYNTCMSKDVPISNIENFPLLPHLQQWLSGLGGQVAEVGRIFEPINIRLATAMVPLGWNGSIGEKKGSRPLKVDILGYGLHLCTLVRAKVNGRWCSTSIEISPPVPSWGVGRKSKLQRMRIRIGDPLHRSASQQERADLLTSEATMNEEHYESSNSLYDMGDGGRSSSFEVDGLGEVTIFCSTDFMTTSKEVAMRLRRVRLLGFEGAGKTSLYFALLGGEGMMLAHNFGGMLPDMDWREGVLGGVSYIDGPGVNLQDLPGDAQRLHKELAVKVGPNSKKLDLVIVVHNLSHKIPQMRASSRPALALLIDEVAAAGVPYILTITNKFAVSADRRQLATMAVMETYQMPPNRSVVVNSCPHVVHGIVADSMSEKEGAGWQPRLLAGSMNLVQRPFRKKEVVKPSEGIENLQALVHRVLLEQEEAAMKEFSKQVLAYEEAKEIDKLEANNLNRDKFAGATTAAGIGAGFGLVIAFMVGAANTLRKP